MPGLEEWLSANLRRKREAEQNSAYGTPAAEHFFGRSHVEASHSPGPSHDRAHERVRPRRAGGNDASAGGCGPGARWTGSGTRTWRPRRRTGRARGRPDPARPGMSGRHDRDAARQLSGARVPGAHHPRLPAAHDTRRTDEHPVPKARFPVIDSHNHTTITAQNVDQMIREMDANNLRVLVNLSGGFDPEARQDENRLHQGLEIRRSVSRVRERELERGRRARMGREGGGRSRSVGEERRHWAQDREEPRSRREEIRRYAAQDGRPVAEARLGCCARGSTFP